MPTPTDELLAQRARFKAFLAARLGSEAEAEDVLQESLLKAWQRLNEVRDPAKLNAWFYQVLRHALIDHVRSRRAAAARDEAWASDPALAPAPAGARTLCRCFEPLLSGLPATQAELLRLVELEGRPVAEVARGLGISANNASVSLHRARAALRAKVEETCGACAEEACLDCDCPPRPA